MAVELKTINIVDPTTAQFQRNVADAVTALSNQKAQALGVLKVTGSQKLVGNEDIVLVDASNATAEVFIILPGVKVLQRRLTVKVTKASSAFPVTVKAVDIPATNSPTIDGANTVSIPKATTGSLTIVSDGTNYSVV